MARRTDDNDTKQPSKALPRQVRRENLDAKNPKPATVGVAPTERKLSAEQRETLQEIYDEGQEAFADMGARLLAFGRLVFRKVFGNDSTAALALKTSKDPLWVAVKKAAGGQRLRLDLRTVSAAVRMAAWDQRLNDDAFKGLDWGRKRLLLPLGEDDQLRETAQYVVAMKLDYDATEKYVRNARKGTGAETKSRMTPERAGKHIDAFAAKLTENRALPKLTSAVGKLEPQQKKAMREKVAKAIAALKTLEDALDE